MEELPFVVHMPHVTRRNILREMVRILKRLSMDTEYRANYVSLQERLQQPCDYIALMSQMDIDCFGIAVSNIVSRSHRLKAPNRKLFKEMDAVINNHC